MRVGVLASGSGTILRAMLDRRLPIAVVLADRPCGALEIAAGAGIAAELVERTDFTKSFDREGYTKEVVTALDRIVGVIHVVALDLDQLASGRRDLHR